MILAPRLNEIIKDKVRGLVGGLVEYFRDNGRFPTDQAKFVKDYAKVL